MQAFININKPEKIELGELRPGDNFEHQDHCGWIFKVASGLTESFEDKRKTLAVVESSGEIMIFKLTDLVYPLLETTANFSYDFDRSFEEDR